MSAYRDIAVAIALIGLAIGAMLGVRHLDGWASLYPILMAGALVVGALLLIGAAAIGRKATAGTDPGQGSGGDAEQRLRDVLPVIVASAGLVAAAPWLGFYPATFLYLAGFFAWRSALGPFRAILLGAVLTVAIYVVFGLFLGVPTPDGLVGAVLQG